MAIGRRPLFLALDLVIGLSVPTTRQLVFSREIRRKARQKPRHRPGPAVGVTRHHVIGPLGVSYSLREGTGDPLGGWEPLTLFAKCTFKPSVKCTFSLV